MESARDESLLINEDENSLLTCTVGHFWTIAIQITTELQPIQHNAPGRNAAVSNNLLGIMKFSNSLKFNAVADWWDEYIAYSALKKQIYQLEKKGGQNTPWEREHDLESSERSALMGHDATSSLTDDIFRPSLDYELKKICDFYGAQESELLHEVEELEELVKLKEEESLLGADQRYMDTADDDDDDDDDDDRPGVSHSRERVHARSPSARRRTKSDGRPLPSAPGVLATWSQGSTHSHSGNQRRHSISSSEDNLDLEASLASLGQIPENDPLQTNVPDSSTSPKRTRVALASMFNLVKSGGSLSSSIVPDTIWTAKTNYAYDTRILFKRRITTLYNKLTSLRAYDKIMYSELKDQYMHGVVEEAYPFRQDTKDRLSNAISRLVAMYAKCIAHDDVPAALRQLKVHQREHIAWERDTVWRLMISQERHGDRDGQVKALGGHVREEESAAVAFRTPLGRFRLTSKKVFLTAAVAILAILLNVRTFPGVEASNCFAILVFSTVLWATEAIPLFVTSILVPLLLVFFRVFVSTDDERTRLTAPDATKFIFSQMFSPTIMLLIGGFTISSALSKTNIDRVIITRILSLAGTRPNILGIALAANIGGQSSPISSPQNLIALDEMDDPLDWGQWFAVALPVSAISLLLIWVLLLASYRPSRTIDGDVLVIKEIRPTKEKFTLKQYWVTCVCLFTIGLWCVEKKIEGFVGDMGIIAIIPIVAFFSTGVLRKDDFEQFLWTIVFLAMGGIALGKGVSSSGLLNILGDSTRDLVKNLSLPAVVVVLTGVVLIISTFISHTIASVLLVPIAKEVASNLPGNPQRLLIFLTGLVCSTGMGMPVSGFPNQTAATQEDDMGQLYLSNVDFLKNGVPASIIAAIVVASVGYGLMVAIGI
ncbi:hypothetical protein EW145_g5656 [Phellinidium pouzarii]|uniref:SPX domain-containing protein n=1 Tax=Phellinidium pouzarii TaxID=167371 RepID=A0A4S4KZ93_9AGAM|nr:hypothetical protein EW145_g5656 [Phellinidium pouzarii]